MVGGGTAGLTIATRLVEQKGVSVAVIEAGSFYQSDGGNATFIPAYESLYLTAPASIDWEIFTTPQPVRLGTAEVDGRLLILKLMSCSATQWTLNTLSAGQMSRGIVSIAVLTRARDFLTLENQIGQERNGVSTVGRGPIEDEPVWLIRSSAAQLGLIRLGLMRLETKAIRFPIFCHFFKEVYTSHHLNTRNAEVHHFATIPPHSPPMVDHYKSLFGTTSFRSLNSS